MVRPWHYLCCLLLIAPRLWAAPLSVRFPGPELEQGRTVRVVLGLDRPRPSLEALDLSPWSNWLVVERRGERQLGRDGAQTTMVWARCNCRPCPWSVSRARSGVQCRACTSPRPGTPRGGR